jgi:signal recognition particle GTPase
MFENLSTRLQDIFKKLSGKGRLSEADVDTALHRYSTTAAPVASSTMNLMP